MQLKTTTMTNFRT